MKGEFHVERGVLGDARAAGMSCVCYYEAERGDMYEP